jgi:hypothetical protein
MLIRYYSVITIMVDTISSAWSRSSLKFSPTIGIIHHVFLQHLDSYSYHATLFPAQVWGGINENFISTSFCALYIYVCVHSFWLISLYLWLALIFLFSRVYYGFTPLRHHTSWHYTSRQLSCPYMASYMMANYENAHVHF